jgi:hypothetical protein
MLNKLLTLILINLLFFGFIFSQGLIIDHNCLDISQIPSNYIDSVKSNIRWHYGHTSHGQQLICGLDLLEQSDPFLNVEIGDAYLPDFDDTLCIYNGNNNFTYIMPQGYWSTEQGRSWTFGTLNSNPELNVSAFAWCGELQTYTPEQMQSYLDSITSFEAAYHDVTFIYFTGNAQVGGLEGYTRHMNNNLIRQYCIDNNKVLFDFADIDSWYNDEMNYYIYEGDTIPQEHPSYYGNVCGHVNELSNIQKGKAVWWLMARLAGWEKEIRLNIKVFLEGPFNGTDMNTDLNPSFLPNNQPYNIAPWNYDGIESVSAIPNTDVVDWVLVEMRDTTQANLATEETSLETRAGFLLKDGSVVDLDGISPLKFNTTISYNLFVVIHHLNHLNIIGAYPASLTENTFEYDFTISEYQVYGGMSGHKEIASGIWGMISGDGNGDGTINMDDKYDTWLNQSGQSGYKTSDFDMGGKVDNQDKNEKWLENINMESQIPN